MIDLLHPLAVLANRLSRAQIEVTLASASARRDWPGKVVISGSGVFGTKLEIAGTGVGAADRHRLSTQVLGLAVPQARVRFWQ